jgi:hypothetical protein
MKVMKKISIKLILAIVAIGLLTTQCKKDFADLNQNPDEITSPDLTHLFTDAIYKTAGDEYLQWFYNNSVYFWRFSQITVARSGTSADFNTTGALGGIPLYNVMIDMQEIRYRIDNMPATDKEKYQALKAITYIPQVFLGIKQTDWQGSMPYSEAVQARYTGNFKPKYDTQKELFTLWLKELDDAITVLLAADNNQISPKSQDFIFQGDWIAWARFANSLELRIAARLEVADNALMQSVLTKIVNRKDKDGNLLLITTLDQQATWAPGANELGPGGTNSLWIENYGPAQKFSQYMCTNHDPRMQIFFRKNGLSDQAIANLEAASVTLPSYVKKPVTEPWDRLIGAPVSPDDASNLNYFGPTLQDANSNQYSRLPWVEYLYFKPKQDGGAGEYKNYLLGAPEVCLYLAEFIEKGYISGIGTAKEWYEKGVRFSCMNYDSRASKAQILNYVDRKITTEAIDALLVSDGIKYGTNNKEKIILQEIINLYDNPYEGVAVSRRTGYPKRTSTIWAWQPYLLSGTELKLPRRFPWGTPSDATNLANWQQALSDQGFTADLNTGEALNNQRVWWDKNCPDYGSGN